MRNKIRKHFKAIIAIIYILAITGLALLLYYTYNEALLLIKEQFYNQQILVAKQTAGGIQENIKSLLRELESLSKEPSVRNFSLGECRKIMNAKFVFLEDLDVSNLELLDSKGIVKVSLKDPTLEGKDFSMNEYFLKARALNVANPVFEFIKFSGYEKEKKGIKVAMPVYTYISSFGGVIVFTIKVDELIKGFVPIDSTASKSCVIDSSGNILCNPKYLQFKPDGNMRDTPSLRIFLQHVAAGKPFTGEYVSAQGVKTIAVAYPLRIVDQVWSIIIAAPEEMVSKLLTPFSKKYTTATLFSLFVVASASFVIIILINRWNIELDSMVKVRTKELTLSEEKLRGMVETINELIWEVDADGKYMYVSPIAKKILGYAPEELMGKTVFDLMPENDAQKLKTAFQDIGDSKQPFNNLERVTVQKNGKQIILETNGAPILDDKGNLLGFRGADRDITERKQAESELQKYALELEEARNNLEYKVEERTKELQKVHEILVRKEKLAVLGELASSVSHELRNPLGVIKNAIYYFNMKMDTFKDETVKENIKIITREINIANKIISDLLDFTRSQSPVRLDIDINKLVNEMLSKSSIPKNVKVVTEFSNNMTPISVDPTQVAQIFLNLIENAVQSMGKGGTLKVITKQTEHAAEVMFADEGCGIPQENMEKIFEPLFTTKAKGIGLGLAVSKNMAEANGGNISVKSREGKGSAFTISFTNRG